MLLHVLPPTWTTCRATNSYKCCKLRQHVAQSGPDFYFLQQILRFLPVLPPPRQVATQQILKKRLLLAYEFFPPVERVQNVNKHGGRRGRARQAKKVLVRSMIFDF